MMTFACWNTFRNNVGKSTQPPVYWQANHMNHPFDYSKFVEVWHIPMYAVSCTLCCCSIYTTAGGPGSGWPLSGLVWCLFQVTLRPRVVSVG
jgi:hypothetical protein